MKIENLDPWQKEILKTEGNILLISGRRIGKSEVLAIDAAEYAANNQGKSVLVISHTERQAYWLFEKILAHLTENYRSMILKGKNRPTKTQLKLNNKTIIRCLPTGLTGAGVRGIGADRLYPDEAHYIPEDVWSAVIPMLMTGGGVIRASTTPRGTEGYLYDHMYKNEHFKIFHKSSEEVLKNRKISPTWTAEQRESSIKHIEQHKKTMTKLIFSQEYMGEFVSEIKQVFSDALIKECMDSTINITDGKKFLGVDVGGLGGDWTTLEGVMIDKDKIMHYRNDVMEHTYTTEVSRTIINLDKAEEYTKIYVDDGGIGFGVFSELLENEQTKRRVVPINNAQRPLDKDNRRKKKVLVEDLYNNLLNLMEKKKIKLISDPEVFISLKSVQKDFTEKGNVYYHGNNTHIAQGLIRAVWGIKDKSLNIWFDWC